MSRQCLDGVASLCVVPSRVCSVTRFLRVYPKSRKWRAHFFGAVTRPCDRSYRDLYSLVYIHVNRLERTKKFYLLTFTLCNFCIYFIILLKLLVCFLPYGTPCRSCYVTRARLAYTKYQETRFSISGGHFLVLLYSCS